MKYKRSIGVIDLLEVISWVAVFGLPFLTSISYFVYVPIFFILFVLLRRNSRQKKDLKNARNYFRVKHGGWQFDFMTIVPFAVFVVAYFAPDNIRTKSEFPVVTVMVLVILAIFLKYRLLNFVHGFRWYVSGIKLPGERSLLIPWRHISKVRREEGTVFLTVLGKDKSFQVHAKDRRAAEAFVRHYERITAPQD